MVDRTYKKLEGMTLKYVSGLLQENPKESSIYYEVTFDLGLDFLHFEKMANSYIPGYLNKPINAIRPELDGIAYHYSYNYLFRHAGNIHDSEALFKVFASPAYYMNQWGIGAELEVRYGEPAFEPGGGKLRITARQDFRLKNGGGKIQIKNLPIISFNWALNLMEGHQKMPVIASPGSVVVCMYTEEDKVDVGGLKMFRGARYMVGSKLAFGVIKPEQIRTAQ